MKCHLCGTQMKPVVADLPFRVNRSVMIIIRELPLLECGECSAYALQDVVMERVHAMVQGLTPPSHLDGVRYTA
jgi:YgiT-type zinc finger domain-containing protein